MNFLRRLVRSFSHQPTLNLLIVGLCALGIALSTSVFALVKTVLLDPLPYRDSGQLYVPWGVAESFGIDTYPFSWPNYLDYAERIEAFSGLAATRAVAFTVDAGDAPRSISGNRVSANFLEVVGLGPLIGSDFRVDGEGRADPRQALVSHRLWLTELGGDPSMLGEPIRLDGEPYEIVGVLPPELHQPTSDSDILIPLEIAAGPEQTRGFHFMRLLARLDPAHTIEEATQQAETVAADLAATFPEANQALGIRLESLRDSVIGGASRSLTALFVAIQALFLVAWANMAILLLARGVARAPELRIRAALGATRRRLVTLVIGEAVALALIGCGLGLVGGRVLLGALRGIDPSLLPRAHEIGFEPLLLAYAIAVTLAGASLAALLPALHATRATTARDAGAARSTDRRSQRLHGRLAAAQVALVLPLLIGAGMQLRSVAELARVELGFSVDGLLAAGVALPTSQFTDGLLQRQYIERAVEALEALPAVQSAAAISRLPFAPGGASIVTYRPDMAGQSDLPNADFRIITPQLFATMGVPLLDGRDLRLDDDADSRPVVLIDQTLAELLYPGESAVGREVRLGNLPTLWEVAGVTAPVRHRSPDAPPTYTVYVAIEQNPFVVGMRTPRFVIRTGNDPLGSIVAVRRTLQEVDRDQAVLEVRPISGQLDDWLADRRAFTRLLWGISIASLALAFAGLYGVLTFTLGQRMREMAVRQALGAGPRRLARNVFVVGLRPALVGAGVGLAIALVLARWLAARTAELASVDPLSALLALALVLLAALAAALLPARRVLRADPAPLLRGEGVR